MPASSVPITPSVLEWAMDQAALGREEVASQLKVEVSVIDSWLSGSARPPLGQFRKLAALLGRPETTLLLPEPPRAAGVPPAFRHPPGTPPGRAITHDEAQAVRTARRVQKIARWVVDHFEEGDMVSPALPSIAAGTPPEKAARELSSWLDWDPELQLKAKNPWNVLRELRTRLERLGVLALHLGMGPDGCRGFSLADDTRPLLAVNTWYRPEPRIFSYGHEMAHLASGTSSICVGYEATQTERWCERVAGALFLPAESVSAYLEEQFGVSEVTSADQLSKVASKFKVSLSAATVRLLQLGLAPRRLGVLIDHGRDSHTDASGGRGERNCEKRLREWGVGFSSLMLDADQHGLVRQHVILEYLDLPRSQLDEWRSLARAADAAV